MGPLEGPRCYHLWGLLKPPYANWNKMHICWQNFGLAPSSKHARLLVVSCAGHARGCVRLPRVRSRSVGSARGGVSEGERGRSRGENDAGTVMRSRANITSDRLLEHCASTDFFARCDTPQNRCPAYLES